MDNGGPEKVWPLYLASLLNNVSPSQLSSRDRSFGWIAELRDAIRDAIRSAIPTFIELLNHTRWNVRVAAVSALATSSKYVL